jgi:hypothetical protein
MSSLPVTLGNILGDKRQGNDEVKEEEEDGVFRLFMVEMAVVIDAIVAVVKGEGALVVGSVSNDVVESGHLKHVWCALWLLSLLLLSSLRQDASKPT